MRYNPQPLDLDAKRLLEEFLSLQETRVFESYDEFCILYFIKREKPYIYPMPHPQCPIPKLQFHFPIPYSRFPQQVMLIFMKISALGEHDEFGTFARS